MHQVRRAEESDLSWIIETARRKYPPFDDAAAMAWGKAMIREPDALVLRTRDAWCVACCGPRFWAPDTPLAHVLLLCSARDDRKSAWQLMALLRAVYKWAIERDCWRLDIESETVGDDFGPLAKRLSISGAVRQTTNYVVNLIEDRKWRNLAF